jgi:hypothetical protein
MLNEILLVGTAHQYSAAFNHRVLTTAKARELVDRMPPRFDGSSDS